MIASFERYIKRKNIAVVSLMIWAFQKIRTTLQSKQEQLKHTVKATSKSCLYVRERAKDRSYTAKTFIKSQVQKRFSTLFG